MWFTYAMNLTKWNFHFYSFRQLGPLFFVSFVVLVYFMMVNLMLGIIGTAYFEVTCSYFMCCKFRGNNYSWLKNRMFNLKHFKVVMEIVHFSIVYLLASNITWILFAQIRTSNILSEDAELQVFRFMITKIKRFVGLEKPQKGEKRSETSIYIVLFVVKNYSRSL